MVVEVAAIVEASQPVDNGKFHRVLEIEPQMLVITLAPDLRQRAGDEFVRIDRAENIIVHAEIERARHHLIRPLLRHQKQRQETGAFQRAKLRAQPQRIVVLEIGIDDDELEGVARRLEQRRLRLRDSIDLCNRLQRPDDTFLRAGAAVRHQYAAGRLHQAVAAQHLLDADLACGFGAQP
ncbi:hypothetical protein D3C72_689310 [compost metagenome]